MADNLNIPLFEIEGDELENVQPEEVETKETDTEEVNIDTDEDYVSENTNSLNVFESALDTLHSRGLLDIDELPEELDGKDLTMEDMITVLEKSLEQKTLKFEEEKEQIIQATFVEVLENMSEITRRGFEFERTNPNPDEIKDFYNTLINEVSIKSLSPSHPEEAKQIMKHWYKQQGWSDKDIEEEIEDAVNVGKLETKASKLKPQLDKIAEDIAEKKVNERKAILDNELSMKKSLAQKLDSQILAKDNIDGIPLSKDLKTFLRKAIVEDEVPVMLKGQEIQLPLTEAIMMFHRYSKDGSLDLLSKALIMLHEPELFEKSYAKKVQTKEVDRFVKEHKHASSERTGLFSNKKTPNNNTTNKIGVPLK